MANTLSGPAACCRCTPSWWRPVCLDRAQRGTVAVAPEFGLTPSAERRLGAITPPDDGQSPFSGG